LLSVTIRHMSRLYSALGRPSAESEVKANASDADCVRADLGQSPNGYSQPPDHSLSAEQTDPYGNGDPDDQIATYKYLRAEVLDNVRTVYFAVGCRVLPEGMRNPSSARRQPILSKKPSAFIFSTCSGLI
jgi:hypothetical protein